MLGVLLGGCNFYINVLGSKIQRGGGLKNENTLYTGEKLFKSTASLHKGSRVFHVYFVLTTNTKPCIQHEPFSPFPGVSVIYEVPVLTNA